MTASELAAERGHWLHIRTGAVHQPDLGWQHSWVQKQCAYPLQNGVLQSRAIDLYCQMMPWSDPTFSKKRLITCMLHLNLQVEPAGA